MVLHVWPCPRAPMWVTLNLYWTQNIPLQKKFNNNVLQHPWVITLKWLEGSSLEFQESSDPEAKQTRLQDRACPTMCKMSHGTIQWPQTEATGHTYTHKQTHAFSMQAQKTHTHSMKRHNVAFKHTQHKHTEQGDSKWHGRVIQWPIHCILLFL